MLSHCKFTPKQCEGRGLLGCAIAPSMWQSKNINRKWFRKDSIDRYDMCGISLAFGFGLQDLASKGRMMKAARSVTWQAYHRHIDESYEWKALSLKTVGN